MSAEALEFLTGGGGPPSVKFPEVGAKIVGRVLKYEMVQQRDFQSKKPKFWDDGNPMMQACVTLQAEEWEPVDEDDDGKRRLYVKGKMRDAVIAAVNASGHKGSLIGGKLGVSYSGDGEKTGGQSPPKLYKAKYEPPSAEQMLADEPPADDPDTSPF